MPEDLAGDDEDTYIAGGPIQMSRRERMMAYLDRLVRKEKFVYAACGLGLAGLCYWIDNWWPMAFAVISGWIVYKVMREFSRSGAQTVIEARLQNQKLECEYFYPKRYIYSPTSWIRVYQIPKARLKDVVAFGDQTPPAPAQNIWVVDYIEPQENGDILIKFPDDPDFSNFAGLARINPELVAIAQHEGEKLATMQEFRSTAIQMFHEGRLGGPEQAKAKLGIILGEVDQQEARITSTPALKRQWIQHYQSVVPWLRNQLLDIAQRMPTLVNIEATKLLHRAFDHPFARSTIERMQRGEEELLRDKDYDAAIKRLQDQGLAGADDTKRTARQALEPDRDVVVRRS